MKQPNIEKVAKKLTFQRVVDRKESTVTFTRVFETDQFCSPI